VAVDGRIVVHLEWVLRVVGDVGLRLPLVGQSPCVDLRARLATMWRWLWKKKDNYMSCRIER
jgi:hypothetical protein